MGLADCGRCDCASTGYGIGGRSEGGVGVCGARLVVVDVDRLRSVRLRQGVHGACGDQKNRDCRQCRLGRH
jgi:hypothetical protein